MIGAKDTISPLHPGITAAMGLLMTELQYEYTRSVLVVRRQGRQGRLRAGQQHPRRPQGRGRAPSSSATACPTETHRFTAVAECRYVGQGFELRAAMPDGPLGPDNVKAVIRNFFDAHKQVYGHAFEDQLVEIITLRVVGSAATDTLKLPELAKGGRTNPDDGRSSISATRCSTTANRTRRHAYARAKLLADDSRQRPGADRPAQFHDPGAARLCRLRAFARRHARRALSG